MDENKMTLFTNEELGNVRALEIDGEPYFVGKDVAVALGYAKPENAISAHVDQEDKTTTLIQGGGSNYKSKTTLINESGLYSLILSSKLPKAKEFKHWITAEVLPVIRKTGGYVNDTKQFVDYYFSDCNTYGREAITLIHPSIYLSILKFIVVHIPYIIVWADFLGIDPYIVKLQRNIAIFTIT